MSIQRTSTSSPTLTPQWKYDVFLSFRGEDTRKAFTDNLYTELEHEGIKTFRDDPELPKGETIAPALFAAIEESRFAVIVLSQNYASSTWCLNELVKILECMNARGRVLPVFYNVDPSDVRKQTGSFGEAFANHEERFADDKEIVQRWRSALTEVASFSGWNSKDWYERKLIRAIVKDILEKLQTASFIYAKNLVGMDSRLQQVFLHLGVGVDDVRFIGIWGMGGIGKTTMVRAVYERISRQFEFTFLLTNVRETVEKGGLLNLQKQLLSGMIQTKKVNHIYDLHEGATALKRWLGRKNVLLILDDVNQSNQLEYLSGNPDWFGPGSRVLITTRNEHLLIQHEVKRRLKAEELNHDDSLQLFSMKAFKKDYPEEDFLSLSEFVVRYVKGLPLALEVLGSFLYGRVFSEWNSALSQLGRVCNSDIFDVLKISYTDLDSDGKKIFLDIACFFSGHDKDRVTEVLNCSDVAAIIGIKVLMERSLVTLSDGRLWMHDLLREMGHEIVRLEAPNEPGRRSRLWLHEDVKHVLTQNTGTEAMEGIFVDSTESGVEVTPKSFSMMPKLRYLKIKNGNLPKRLEYLPNSLRILDWTRYPLKSLPADFNPRKLFELTLCHSCIERLRIGTEPLYNLLKIINLSHSLNLVRTPNFRVMPYLEFLYLEGCIRLYQMDTGIEVLERLTVLNLKDCQNLVRLPSSIGALKSLKDLNLSGCSKLEKLPDELGHVACLENLDVSGGGLTDVPSSICLLKNLKKLSLAGLKAQSRKPWNMMLNPLQLLRKRSRIPTGLSLPCLSSLHSLTTLNLSDCNLSEEAMPSDFGCLASLKGLDLSNNQFVRLPESIGQLSRLVILRLNGCRKLRIVPELPSNVWVNATNCMSLDTLGHSVTIGNDTNCFKMLARYFEGKPSPDKFGVVFVGSGNEIPEWCNYQYEGSSITLQLHPGWFTNKFLGFAFFVVFRLLKPLPPSVLWYMQCSLAANGKQLRPSLYAFFGREWGQPMGDHMCIFYMNKNFLQELELQDIYYLLELSFTPVRQLSECVEENVQVKKCGFCGVYEQDVEELRQRLLKQRHSKRGIQLSDDAPTLRVGGSRPRPSWALFPRVRLRSEALCLCFSLWFSFLLFSSCLYVFVFSHPFWFSF